MKQCLFLLLCFLSKAIFAQYKIDTAIKVEYKKLFERLGHDVKQDTLEFKSGLGILVSIKNDTLNKKDLAPIDTSLKIYPINPKTGEKEPWINSPNEEEAISETQPGWLFCGCKFKGEDLEISSGISVFSGFGIIIRLSKNKGTAIYTEHTSDDKAFKTKLTDKKVSELTLPATINGLTIDRLPGKEIPELYGKVSVTSIGYYDYANAWNFKHGYIHKRMNVEYYFKCIMAGSTQR